MRKKIVHLLNSEKIGLTLSILCAIHCLSLPFVLFFTPYIASSFVFNDSFEWLLVGISFILAAILLISDYKKHQNRIPLIYLGIAFIAKLIDYLLHQSDYHWFYGILLGIFISLAYWKNYQHKRICKCNIH